MDMVALLGRTLAFSLAAGINLYATVALVGLAVRFGWVAVPSDYQAFGNPWVIGIASALYLVEFVADKVPWVDTLWDAVHTFIRPIGGAALAVASLGHASPTMTVLAALLGGAVAAGSHATKTGTRVIANTSPEPFSNWFLSLAEDGVVVALGVLAMKFPVIALAVSLVVILVIVSLATVLVRALRRRFGSAPASVAT